MPVNTVKIVNLKGLHARAAAAFAKASLGFPGVEINVRNQAGQSAAGQSIMDLLMLAAGPGSTLEIETSGDAAQEALEQLSALVENRFGEAK